MTTMNSPNNILKSALCVLLMGIAQRAAADVAVQCREEYSAAFGGEDVALVLEVRSDRDQEVVLTWKHEASEQRVISRGDRRLALKRNEPAAVELALRTS